MSLFNSYSQAGVNSDETETTYVEELRISQIAELQTSNWEHQARPLNTTITLHATLVQSSEGYWRSIDIPILEYAGETTTSLESVGTGYQYESCTLDTNEGIGSCTMRGVSNGETSYRNAWMGTLDNVVRTEVAVPSGFENGAAFISVGAQFAVVMGAIALGVVLVL
ncbi:hypothetical protein VNI00_018855 [Paramarasmius palmivorus]|uniref:Uncharacterized protein n=1 Tax=Paramarasmius palmivorus TaxID=297713 RepID=A0AAW0ATF7_9AGAR